jgi:hypothetical protein
MSVVCRSIRVVYDRLAMRDSRPAAARRGHHGLQVMSFEQAAVRLAGGFTRPIDEECLRTAIQAVLPVTPMGDLESIKTLPGMIDAAADTLRNVWHAGLDPVATERNVALQISGLAVRGQTWRAADNVPVIRDAITIVGVARCRSASNVPVNAWPAAPTRVTGASPRP